jgi:S-adenosylmethionine hydrolase
MTAHQHIALFTDFGYQDAYVAQLKGAILTINPRAKLLDLSHHITPFDLRQAAYLLEQSTRFLPADTIIVAVVDPGVGSERYPIGLQTEAHKYYIGPDNGLFTCVVESEKVVAAHLLRNTDFFLNHCSSTTFHGRDIFAPVAAHLSLGVELQAFGPALTDLVLLPFVAPRQKGRTVCGEIIHIDHYGNVITSISKQHLEYLQVGDEVVINIAGVSYRILFCSTYSDEKPGQLICLFNSNEAFELARPLHDAATFLGVKGGETLSVTY